MGVRMFFPFFLSCVEGEEEGRNVDSESEKRLGKTQEM